ncbi:MAG: PhzF family phenazine biosynthesis protein [Bacteroidota bacterium]|nr:PhzF family phenazine biosynthesis protein [Bacteroidota bacterium]
MNIEIYQVDAFTNEVFAGNPAAVCLLDQWLEAELMQNIAMENNLAETAFVVKADENYQIRWFTPTVEVDLCGHATLAAAHVLYHEKSFQGEQLRFWSDRSGQLLVKKDGERLQLDFPADSISEIPVTPELQSCFSVKPLKIFKGKTDYMFIFKTEESIRNISPNLSAIASLDARGLIASAPGKKVDFVSRFFAPQSGIIEDPVTGSAHTSLTPYWSAQLGKQELEALQLSTRGGHLFCSMEKDRVLISGYSRLYLRGEIVV